MNDMYSILLWYLNQSLSTDSDTEMSLDEGMDKRQIPWPEKRICYPSYEPMPLPKFNFKVFSQNPSYTKTTTNQENKIDSFHDFTLRNKFSEMVNPYIDNFKKIIEENIKNLEFFAKNTVFAIIFKSTSHKKINFMTKLIEKLILKCENSSNVKSMYHASR
ncbi:hypothetical protein COBT_003666, partial [Conglomerata obtusa]